MQDIKIYLSLIYLILYTSKFLDTVKSYGICDVSICFLVIAFHKIPVKYDFKQEKRTRFVCENQVEASCFLCSLAWCSERAP